MSNHVPRNFKWIVATALTDSNAGRVGDRFTIVKDKYGIYVATNNRTEEEWQVPVGLLRNEHFYELEVVA